MLRMLCAVALFVSCAGCGGDISYPPPPQRMAVPHRVNAVLRFAANQLEADQGADQGEVPWASILQDVLPAAPGADWRWTRAHPAFRFQLMDYQGWQAVVRVTAVAKVLAATGPQHVVVTVNGTRVGRAVLNRSGGYDLTFPVDPAILKSANGAVLRLDIDPCMPADSPWEKGLPYCVLLHSIGFVRP
jgi:hypothetical protein